MSDDSPHVEQKAEGTGIAQAAGEGAIAISFFGIPIEKWLMGELVAAIVIQGLGYFCSLGTSDPAFCILSFGICFPIVFGLPALFGLIMGIGVKNKKIITLSLVSGALSLLVFGPLYLCGSLYKLAEWLGSR
jgi:hypothetical protein